MNSEVRHNDTEESVLLIYKEASQWVHTPSSSILDTRMFTYVIENDVWLDRFVWINLSKVLKMFKMTASLFLKVLRKERREEFE